MNDLISRAELFNKLATAQDKADCFSVIQGMPTIEAEPVRHGHWKIFMFSVIGDRRRFYNCSVCNYEVQDKKTNYCPDCGQAIDWGDE